jgi:hypothetical protein
MMMEPQTPSDSESANAARIRVAGVLTLQLSALAVAWWVRSGNPFWILLAVPPTLFGLIVAGRRERRLAIAGAFLVFAIIAALAAERHLALLSEEWDERSASWEAEAQEKLRIALEDLLRDGEESAAELALLWEEGAITAPPTLPPGLRRPGVGADVLA